MRLQSADGVQVLEVLHSGGAVDMDNQVQEMAAADDTHLEVVDSVDRRFLQLEDMDSQDDWDPDGG